MPTLLWIPIGFVALGLLGGAMVGARSRSSSAGSGALIGLFIAFIFSFPLLAIGIADI